MDAVIFDLDGTLCTYALSTEEVLEEALAGCKLPGDALGTLTEAAKRYNELWLELERGDETIDDLRRIILARMLSAAGNPSQAIADRLAAAYGEVRNRTGVVLYDGVASFLTELHAHYRLGLLTNGPSELQWEKIDALELRPQFDAILVAGDVNIYKPDKQVFDLLLSELAVDPERSLFVGDWYDMDIVGARAAGMRTAWVSSDPLPQDVDRPDWTVESASSLRGVLL